MNDDLIDAVTLVFVAFFYFLPTYIAVIRRKAHGTGGVFILNLVVGWTVLGWFVAIILAFSGHTVWGKRREKKRHRDHVRVRGAANRN